MFKRIANLFRGFFGLAVSNAERANPEALLEVEGENLRKQVASYNQGLVSHAALCERLMTQVKKLEADQTDIRAKTSAHLRIGNRGAAGQYALRLQTIESELTENRKQLEQAETTYRDLVRARDVAIAAAKQKIESIKADISDLKTKKALASLTETASGMITNIGGSGDTLDRLQTMIREDRARAAGRVRVAHDNIDSTGVLIKEAEQQALADQALADFAAREGIALEPLPSGALPSPTLESARKSMGPVSGGPVSTGSVSGGSAPIKE
jgi:phage shock protein A